MDTPIDKTAEYGLAVICTPSMKENCTPKESDYDVLSPDGR
jgi:hypothetical protein